MKFGSTGLFDTDNLNMKHYSKGDIEYAVNFARLNLNRRSDENNSIDYDKVSNGDNIQVINSSKEKQSLHISKTKFNEIKMRYGQASKMATEIIFCIKNLEMVMEKEQHVKFTSPLESEAQKKRWKSFIHATKRSLYILKRDVSQLSSIHNEVKNKERSLRLLINSSRLSLNLLKGLQKFETEIQTTSQGNCLLRDVIFTANRLLYIIDKTIGMHSYRKEEVGANKFESMELSRGSRSDGDDIEILTSDMNSDIICTLNPTSVRRRLSRLARRKLHSPNKKKATPSKIIAPLKQEDMSSFTDSQTEASECLSNGHRIRLIQDSLSPKLARKPSRNAQKKGPVVAKAKPIAPTLEQNIDKTTENAYGFSEKVADAFFERIRPFFDGEEKIPRNTEGLTYEDVIPQITELLQRFKELKISYSNVENFLQTSSSLLSRPEDGKRTKNLTEAIQEADQAIRNCSSLDISTRPYLYKETLPSVDIKSRPEMTVSFYADGKEIPKKQLGILDERRSIENEIQKQREEFWLSLINRNFVPIGKKVSEDTDEKLSDDFHKERRCDRKEFESPAALSNFEEKEHIDGKIETSQSSRCSEQIFVNSPIPIRKSEDTQVGESISAEIPEYTVETQTTTKKSEPVLSKEYELDDYTFESSVSEELVSKLESKMIEEESDIVTELEGSEHSSTE